MLVRSGAESVAAFASRTTDLSTRAYPDFPTDLQLDLAVDHFISGLRDASSRDYLRRERARRRISWQEAVQMAQASEVPRAAEYTSLAAAASFDAMCAKTPNFAHFITSFLNDCAMSTQAYHGNTGNSPFRELFRTLHDAYENACASSSYVAQPDNPIDAPKAQWTFDPCNGAPLRAPLELCVPKSQWNSSPYTGLVWKLSPRQSTPITNQYAPLQQVSQFLSPYASRLATQQSTPILNQYQRFEQLNQFPPQHASRPNSQQPTPSRPTTSSSTPRLAYPSMSSDNFPQPLPLIYDEPHAANEAPSFIPKTFLFSSYRVASPTVIEKDAFARRLVATGFYYPSGFGLIPLNLIECGDCRLFS